MNQAQATTAILQRWMTLWPTLSSNVPYVFDNDIIAEQPTYARLSIHSTGSEQHTLGAPGNRKWLRTGLIDVKLYGPAAQGRIGLDAMVGYVRSIFEGARFGNIGASEDGVVCYAASAGEIRPQATEQYWVVLVELYFEFFETS